MSIGNLSRIDPGWTEYHGFESPLLQQWSASGPLEAHIEGLTFSKMRLGPEAGSGPLNRRLEGRPFQTSMEHETPLGWRLTERAPERSLLTRSDETRQLERTRLALIDMGFAGEDRIIRDARRAA